MVMSQNMIEAVGLTVVGVTVGFLVVNFAFPGILFNSGPLADGFNLVIYGVVGLILVGVPYGLAQRYRDSES